MSSRNVSVKVQGEVVEFTGVQKVALDRTASEVTAVYNEITDTTATASDVRTGKKFYTANGVLTTGTYDGGGGSDEPNGWAIETGDTGEMVAAVTAANVGRIYRWMPADPSLIYPWKNRAYYQVYDDSEEVY